MKPSRKVFRKDGFWGFKKISFQRDNPRDKLLV
jgi:hypothetical protein